MKLLLLLCFLSVIAVANSNPIKHIIVLMMENRSFDHLLGYLKKTTDSRIDGLTDNEFNYYNVTDPTAGAQMVNPMGYDTGPDDPGHSWEDTAQQIYGYVPPGDVHGVPKMNGFVQASLLAKKTPENPMSMFNITTAPIINTLATEFAVFDRWHCSLPGPTDPNRGFAMSGSSMGMITNFNGTLWTQQSYFDFLGKHGISWRAHYQDDPWAIMYFKDMQEAPNIDQVSELDDFLTEVKNGILPQFTWLQPRMTSVKGPPTWQHPDASVTEGERLMKTIYETLRASKFWNELAFVITYDEHGGFYDHVPPPQDGIPAPDGMKAPNGFAFDRLGIRIPTVVISPWIKKGTVVSEPNGPTPTSHYDGTSTMATANKIFGIKDHLGKRSAWAGTFENIFTTLASPRDDCPETLPSIPEYTAEALARQRALPLNDHMEIQVEFYCKFNNLGEGCGKDLTNQFEASKFIVDQAKIFMDRMKSK